VHTSKLKANATLCPLGRQIYKAGDDPQKAAGENYHMPSIASANRHQTCFGTPEAQLAADNPAQLVDVFVAAGNAKKPNAPVRHFTTGRGKRQNQRTGHYCRLQRLISPMFAVVKFGVLYQDDCFKKLA
jgi:hypothetical protein